MTFKSLEIIKNNLTEIICGIIILMIVFSDVTTAESLSTLFILTALQAARVINYKYPERPDLFQDVEKLKSQVSSLEIDLIGVKLKK